MAALEDGIESISRCLAVIELRYHTFLKAIGLGIRPHSEGVSYCWIDTEEIHPWAILGGPRSYG